MVITTALNARVDMGTSERPPHSRTDRRFYAAELASESLGTSPTSPMSPSTEIE